MVPTLQIPRKKLRENEFINGYINDVNHNISYNDSVYLLFKPSNIRKFKRFLDNEYERTTSIIEDYDYEDGYIVVVYKLNPHLKKDFNLVRQGKYSKTSEKFQKLFPIVVKIMKGGLHRDELSLQCRIFKKTQDLIDFWEKEFDMSFEEDQEVWRGWVEEKEVLDIKNIKGNVK